MPPPVEDPEQDEKPVKALDEDDIALLKAYGLGPYAQVRLRFHACSAKPLSTHFQGQGVRTVLAYECRCFIAAYGATVLSYGAFGAVRSASRRRRRA
jgi:hypothetical protein